jgi:hypothetical protein
LSGRVILIASHALLKGDPWLQQNCGNRREI